MSKYSSLPDVDTTSKDVFESGQVEPIPDYDNRTKRRDSIDDSGLDTKAAEVFESHEVVDTNDTNFTNLRGYRVKSIPETVEARIARLTREVEEVRQQVGNSNKLDNLRDVLDKLAVGGGMGDVSLYEGLGEGNHNVEEYSTTQIKDATAKLVNMESRITALEKKMGTETIQSRLDDLRTKIYQQYKQSGDNTEVSAIYDKLPMFEQFQAEVPHMISRLRSLNSVHADATTVVSSVRNVDATVDHIKSQITRWIDTINKAESKLKQVEQNSATSKALIENWIKDLESRIEKH